MAQQGTEQKTGASGGDGAGQEPATEESAGRHAAPEAPAAPAQQASVEPSEPETAPAEPKTEKVAAAEPAKAAPAEAKTDKVTAPTTAPAEPAKAAPAEPKTEKVAPAEPEAPRHRSVDVGELAWRTGNVLATVVRTLALLFALVLVVNVVLVLVGVNPANGVAQFVSGVANIVIVGFRDLFIPTSPVLMLVVNSLVAAVFWVFVGELLSRLIRFVAARVR
jgi:hypothetical protein